MQVLWYEILALQVNKIISIWLKYPRNRLLLKIYRTSQKLGIIGKKISALVRGLKSNPN